MRLVIVGNPDVGHVGRSLLEAARNDAVDARLVDVREASGGSRVARGVLRRLGVRRPQRLSRFSEHVRGVCSEFRADVLLSTGTAPVDAAALRAIGALGTVRVNYSTDDPWNPSHRADWFLKALRNYDYAFSPRRANLEQFRQLTGPRTRYLPFGYDPDLCFVETLTEEQRDSLACDVLFVGGADPDRVPLVSALARTGLRVATYGGYWDRYRETRGLTRGLAHPAVIRQATIAAKVCLCLVRRANRDGHVMRSFEMAASGACMLVEDTDEHRDLFGPDGESVRYFRDEATLRDTAAWLIDRPADRARLARAVADRIASGRHTYRDRLRHMLGEATAPTGRALTDAVSSAGHVPNTRLVSTVSLA